MSNHFTKGILDLSLFLQTINFAIGVTAIGTATRICSCVRRYGVKDILYLLALNICTIPAFATGSLYGLLREKGIFYRTQRNRKEASYSFSSTTVFNSKSSPCYRASDSPIDQ